VSYLGYTSVSHAAYSPSWANRASSTKPEVHNLLQCRQQRTEQRPQVTCTWSLNTLFLRHANGQTQLPSCDTSIKWFDALITYLVPNTAAQLKPLPVSRPSYSVLEASEERQFKQLIYMANAYTLWTYEDSRRLLNHGVRKVVLFGGQLYQSGQCAKVNWVGLPWSLKINRCLTFLLVWAGTCWLVLRRHHQNDISGNTVRDESGNEDACLPAIYARYINEQEAYSCRIDISCRSIP